MSRTQRVAALFRAALDREPAAREAFLAGECGEDAALANDVRALLASVESEDSPLDRAPAQRLGWPDPPGASAPPSRIGPFHLLRLLGRGGMGEVWLADRIEGGFAQQVALKWVDRARLGTGGLDRFARERELLARVDHPAIARLVDGGEVDGTPWFAMEFVDGIAIDRHVAESRLDLAAAVDLMRPVVDAVQHLHRHLIVHRDLKPSNVLVDREGRPRLIDLGIAKSLGDDTQLTGALAPMSVAYAAPEQVSGEAITIATDVWGLGALLHELLSGRSPHDAAASSLPRLVDAIARGTPRLASEALALDPSARPWRPAQLRGDLDLIVAAALRREPERRYASAAALGDDLRRWRERLPIAARRDSARYRARRFIARHPLGTALGGVALASLLGATGYALHQADRAAAAAVEAQDQRDRAKAALADARGTQQAMARVFAAGNPTLAGKPDVAFRDVLAATPEQIADLPPAIRLPVQYTVALARAQIGDAVAAIDGFATAARIADELGHPRARAQAELRRALLALEQVALADSEREALRLMADPAVQSDPLLLAGANLLGAETAALELRIETAMARFATARSLWPPLGEHTLAMDDATLLGEIEVRALLFELGAVTYGAPGTRSEEEFLRAARALEARLKGAFPPDDPRMATLETITEYMPDAMEDRAGWRERLLSSIDAQILRLGLAHPTILARLRTGGALSALNQYRDPELARRLGEAARVVDGGPRRRLRATLEALPTRGIASTLGIDSAALIALWEPVCGQAAAGDVDCVQGELAIVSAVVEEGDRDAAVARLEAIVTAAGGLPPSVARPMLAQAAFLYRELGLDAAAIATVERTIDSIRSAPDLSEAARDILLMQSSWSFRPSRCDRVVDLIGPIESRLLTYPAISGDVLARLLSTCEVRAGRDPEAALARLAPWWDKARQPDVDPMLRLEVVNAHLEIHDVLRDDAEFARWARELGALEAAGLDLSATLPVQRMPWVLRAQAIVTQGSPPD
jgi:GrpB-like predicted nucleotidyltransferase (UPF0157 family)